MNILLLGNGFDLHHNLPTTYGCFLQTLEYLNNEISGECTERYTISAIFENIKGLKDSQIWKSYEAYKQVYKDIYVSSKDINSLLKLIRNNCWFKYFCASLNADSGWVDLERQISDVVDAFMPFIDSLRSEGWESARKIFFEKKHLSYFKFFYDSHNSTILDEYKSGIFGTIFKKLDENKIIEHLYGELEKITQALRLYLKFFVDDTLEHLIKANVISMSGLFVNSDYVFTFNYTNTYEALARGCDGVDNTRISHLHGNVNDRIVLGIPSDKFDEINSTGGVDTLFLPFKKYYQRALYDTDLTYIESLSGIRKAITEPNRIPLARPSLLVVGHSLDVTDKDIIAELFDMANDITILFHNDKAKVSYIRNLVKMFGKKKFDDLRYKKNLTFLPTDTDFYDFSEQRKNSCEYLYEIDFG